MTRDLNLPWTTEKVENDWALPNGAFPWLVLDKWHVVIARFDYEEQARLAVKAANREEYEEIASHRDAMVRRWPPTWTTRLPPAWWTPCWPASVGWRGWTNESPGPAVAA